MVTETLGLVVTGGVVDPEDEDVVPPVGFDPEDEVVFPAEVVVPPVEELPPVDEVVVPAEGFVPGAEFVPDGGVVVTVEPPDVGALTVSAIGLDVPAAKFESPEYAAITL